MTKEHNAETRSNRRLWKVCLEKRDNPPWLSQEESNNKRDKGLADDGKNEDGVKCASVNSGTDVISMCELQYRSSMVTLVKFWKHMPSLIAVVKELLSWKD